MSKGKRSKRDVYADIRRKIITLEFPPGTDLDEGTLVEKYGVSRTPIRETLIRLAGEGLVTIESNRGAHVSPLDIGTLKAYFEAADFVAQAVTRLAALRRTAQDLRAIEATMIAFEDAMRRSDAAGMVDQNDRFHDAIGVAAHNKYLYDAYRRILADHARIAQLCFAHEIETDDAQVKAVTLEQHRALYAAIERRDATAGEQVALAHLALCKTGLQDILARPLNTLSDIRLERVSG